MTALVTKHLPLVAGAPDGVKKLRDLVLELAVCGRLLAQDESDEPADLLIDRIEALKASQISSGAVKRQKAATQPTVQPNHAIPESWRFVQLGDLVEIVRGITFPASEKSKEPSPGRIACLRTANVQSQIEWDDLLYIDESFVSREDQFLQPNDIVMSMANSRELVGKVALVGEESLQRSTFGGFLGVLRPYLIEPRFVMALLRTPSARSALIDSASQTTNIANISLAKLRPLMVALPPLAEQHRIVAKVDELMALCDRLEADQADAEAAHAQLVQALLDSLTKATDAADFRASWQRLSEHFHTLFTTEASIDALKRTVLQLAVMGKLVPQDKRTDSTYDLIYELRSHWARAKLTRKIELLKQVISADRFPLPDSWRWLPFGFLADSRLGKMLDVRKNTGELKPYLRNTNVQWRRFDLDDVKVLRLEAHELDEFRLLKGDLLVCEGGEPGRCAIWKDESQEMYFQKALHRVRPLAGTLPEYLLICLEADCSDGSLAEVFTGATIKHLTGEKLERYAIPVPSPAEQKLIVDKVDELMLLCDQLKAGLAESHQLHGQLAAALVEQAVA